MIGGSERMAGLIARYGRSRELQRLWKDYSVGETSQTGTSSPFLLKIGSKTLGDARAASVLFPRLSPDSRSIGPFLCMQLSLRCRINLVSPQCSAHQAATVRTLSFPGVEPII